MNYLAGLDRAGEALASLQDDKAEAAVKLRAEILTRQGRWPAVANTLRELLPEDLPAGQAVSPAARSTLVNMAVALTLAGDKPALQRLRARYGEAMAAAPDGDTFAMLTEDKSVEGQAPITEVLARAAQAEAFLSAYRKRLADGQLSQLN